VTAALAINPNTVLKAYRELEIKGLAAGRPGHGTFVQASLSQVALPELTVLRRSLSAWLAAADGAGLDEDGVVALFTSALRDFYERHTGPRARGGTAGGGTEGVARTSSRPAASASGTAAHGRRRGGPGPPPRTPSSRSACTFM
jgi:hypothetical protein